MIWNVCTRFSRCSASDVYRLQGNGNLAYQELKKGVLLQNKDTRQALQQPVLTAQRDHLSEKLEFEAYKLRMRKLLNLVTTLFFLLLLVVVVYVSVRVFKKQKKESEQLISHLENENEKIEKEKGKILHYFLSKDFYLFFRYYFLSLHLLHLV